MTMTHYFPMCYSALVTQNAKNLGLTYKARVQVDLFDDLFRHRLEGSGARISLAMEAPFLVDPETSIEKKIAKSIREFRRMEIARFENELFKQSKRLADAERVLISKTTKRAVEDVRVSGSKIENLKTKILAFQNEKTTGDRARIFPNDYAPLVILERGERVVAPFRYLLRPKGQAEEFDRKYGGCYNARRDKLESGAFWRPIFGRNHGVMEFTSFWERVALNDYEKRALRSGESETRIELRFVPEAPGALVAPCLYDLNEEGDFPLYSFALITDDPNPEIAAVGHDRTPVILRPNNVDDWLDPSPKDNAIFQRVLEEKQPTFFANAAVSA